MLIKELLISVCLKDVVGVNHIDKSTPGILTQFCIVPI